MPDLALLPRSPLEGVLTPGRHGREAGPPGVTVTERVGLGMASVVARRGQADALAASVRDAFGLDLPTTPRRAVGRDVAFVWSGPDQWLAVAEGPLAESPLAEVLEAVLAERLEGLAAVADQGNGRALLRVHGPRARAALAKGVPIDLDPRAFRPGDAALTAASHIGLQLWQLDEAPTYEIAVARGFAASFWRWLAASSAEYGCEVTRPGLPVPGL